MYGMPLRARRRRQGKPKGINDDGEALKSNGKALSGDGESLRRTDVWRAMERRRICVKLDA